MDYMKREKNLVVIDSGDLLNEHIEIKDSFLKTALLKADLIARIYKANGIDAINVGELDLALGLDYIRELEEKYDIPVYPPPILWMPQINKALFDPYVIKDMDGFKVGIIGMMGNSSDVSRKLKEVAGDSLTVLDPVETVEKLVAELTDKVDFLVVMTHQHMGRNWVIARKIDGIDVIAGGHHKQKADDPVTRPMVLILSRRGKKASIWVCLKQRLLPTGQKRSRILWCLWARISPTIPRSSPWLTSSSMM